MSIHLSHSKDYHNLLNDVITNELLSAPPNNEVLWVAMGNELEIQGVEKIQISLIIRKDIEDRLYEKQFKEFVPRNEYRYTSSHYFRVMKKNNWTNPYMARNTKDDVEPPGGQEIVPYTNHEMKVISDDIINLCKILRNKSKDGIPFEHIFGEEQMSEFYQQVHTVIDNCKNAVDNKTKVPKNTEIFLLECLGSVLGSTNKCVEIFMENNLLLLKEQGKFFTTKQATKFQRGMKQSQQFILKPSSRDMALYLDYTGVQCICGSYRVRQKRDTYNLECYDCDKTIPPSHISKCNNCSIPLYKERLLYMVNHKNKCRHCDTVNDLPQELIQYAMS